MASNACGRFSGFRVIGASCTVSMVVLTIIMGGEGAVFFNAPSLILVLGLTLGLLLAAHGADALRFSADASRFFTGIEPNPKFAAIAREGSRFALASGAVGALIGVIQMLATLDDPSKIGRGMAVALLAPLYGLILSEFVFGVLHSRYAIPADASNPPSTRSHTGLGIIASIVGLILVSFLVLLLSFSVIGQGPLEEYQQGNPPVHQEASLP